MNLPLNFILSLYFSGTDRRFQRKVLEKGSREIKVTQKETKR